MTQQSFVIAGNGDLRGSLEVLLERAGFACRIFSSATDYLLHSQSKDGAVIAEIRLGDANAPTSPGRSAEERARAAWMARERLQLLTPRERSVLVEVAKGHSNKVAARNLGISPRTIEVHRARIMTKLNANNLSELIRLAVMAGVDGSFA